MNAAKSAHGHDLPEQLRQCFEEVEQLRDALDSRAVIDQAKGILMGRYGISADGAFDLLSRVSQDRNHKVRLLAQALVADASDRGGDQASRVIDVSVFDASRAKDPRGSAG